MVLAATESSAACRRCSQRSPSAPNLRVLHVLEATLGGTRRILQEGVVTTLHSPMAQGLVYGTARADKDFFRLLERVRTAGWFLTPVDVMRRSMNLLDDSLAIGQVRRAIQEFRPDVLHLRSAKAGGIGRLAAATLGKKRPRIVYSPHALPAPLGSAYMSAERVLAPLADRFMADSESERLEIISRGLGHEGRVDVVYPAIDVTHYAPTEQQSARHQLALPANVPIVVGIGRLCYQKDPSRFVEIIANLRKYMPDLIGIWVGDGELRQEVETASHTLHLGKALKITGWLADVRPWIAASDVLLSTSRYESLGLFVAEAFAMERPVVASMITGTVDVFPACAQSFLYPAGNVDDATNLLRTLLIDPALRRSLGAVGRDSMKTRFSHAEMHAALCRSYEAALE